MLNLADGVINAIYVILLFIKTRLNDLNKQRSTTSYFSYFNVILFDLKHAGNHNEVIIVVLLSESMSACINSHIFNAFT